MAEINQCTKHTEEKCEHPVTCKNTEHFCGNMATVMNVNEHNYCSDHARLIMLENERHEEYLSNLVQELIEDRRAERANDLCLYHIKYRARGCNDPLNCIHEDHLCRKKKASFIHTRGGFSFEETKYCWMHAPKVVINQLLTTMVELARRIDKLQGGVHHNDEVEDDGDDDDGDDDDDDDSSSDDDIPIGIIRAHDDDDQPIIQRIDPSQRVRQHSGDDDIQRIDPSQRVRQHRQRANRFDDDDSSDDGDDEPIIARLAPPIDALQGVRGNDENQNAQNLNQADDGDHDDDEKDDQRSDTTVTTQDDEQDDDGDADRLQQGIAKLNIGHKSSDASYTLLYKQ